MPVCKFYLQGSCKYGDRCYNEHPRQTNRRQQWDDGGGGYGEGQQYDWHEGGRGQQQRYKQEGDRGGFGQSPLTRGQHYNEDNSYRERSYQTSGRSNERGFSQDKYHWSKDAGSNNRFAPLAEEKKPENDAQTMLSTIQTDIKVWAESKMWPFSCYAYTKGAGCIEGLPDISPEEMRVLALLHPTKYRNILSEVEATFCKIKDELFAMSDAVKSNLISQMNIRENNPSQDLKIAALYGPGFNFEEKGTIQQAGPVASPPPTSPETPAKLNPFLSSQQNNPVLPQATFGAPAVSQQPVSSFKPTVATPEKPQNISIFGHASVQNPATLPENDEVYTPHDSLTDNEKKKFEADRFTIGDIPTRPPSEHYCR